MKFLTLLFLLVATSAAGQFTYVDLRTVSYAIKKPYQRDPDAFLVVLEGLQNKGFPLGSYEYERVTTSPVSDYRYSFTLQDNKVDNITENITISTAPGVSGAALGTTVVVSIETDNLTQYNKWLTDVRTDPNLKRTINQPFSETYESGTINGSTVVTISIPFRIVTNNPPIQERFVRSSTTYQLVIIRVFPNSP